MDAKWQQVAWDAGIAQMAVGILKSKGLIGSTGTVNYGDLVIKTDRELSEEDDCMFRVTEISIKILYRQKIVFAIIFEWGKAGDQFQEGIREYLPGHWEKDLRSARQACAT